MMRTVLFCLLWLPVLAWGQENVPYPDPKRLPFTLKIAPFNLVNPYKQSVDVHADLPFSRRWGIDLGIGVVVNSDVFAAKKEETYRGLKVQPAVKYYLQRSDRRYNYLSFVFKYIDVNNDRFATISRQGDQYAEWILHRKRLVTQGFAVRFGSQHYLGRSRRFFLEPYVGLGWRKLRITDGALPPDTGSLGGDGTFFFQRRPGVYETADFMAGFYVGWTIGKSR